MLACLDRLSEKARAKCISRIERLAEMGHELKRPEADLLRDGIYELRARHGRVNYRILYFFHEGSAVLAHGLTKEGRVPDGDIDRARRRRARFVEDPAAYTLAE